MDKKNSMEEKESGGQPKKVRYRESNLRSQDGKFL